ncbi:MAG TPA: alpha/beta hydrolase [Rhodospirillaceae bacterium]|nr:alpha/beta hydrolase [Rhodospirillaceae bacterium]
MNAPKHKHKKKINLALQGGGAHGAFTWGVLDYLLEDGRLDIEGITATSAGAMNAAALAHGRSEGGYPRAREMLEYFWREVAEAGLLYNPVRKARWPGVPGLPAMEEMAALFNPLARSWAENWGGGHAATFAVMETLKRSVSPYQFNPLNINPLRDILEKSIDFNEVNLCDCTKLFITATNVRTGTETIFRNKDITIDVLMASAALPFLYRAVEINGEPYWDGGYMGNPSLWPLFYEAECRDILIVHINPIEREEIPKESYTIENRLNEITFNGSLLRELRSIAFVKKLIEGKMLKDKYMKDYKNILIHAIRTDDVLRDLSIASKFDTDWGFLCELRDLGRGQAKDWTNKNFNNINEIDTVDIRTDYLNGNN